MDFFILLDCIKCIVDGVYQQQCGDDKFVCFYCCYFVGVCDKLFNVVLDYIVSGRNKICKDEVVQLQVDFCKYGKSGKKGKNNCYQWYQGK